MVIEHVKALPDDAPPLQLLSAHGGWWASFGHEEWEEAVHQAAIHCGDKQYPHDAASAGKWFATWADQIDSELKSLALGR